jgi:hypothetical protein
MERGSGRVMSLVPIVDAIISHRAFRYSKVEIGVVRMSYDNESPDNSIRTEEHDPQRA